MKIEKVCRKCGRKFWTENPHSEVCRPCKGQIMDRRAISRARGWRRRIF